MWHAEDIPIRRVDVPEWRWTDDTEMALSIVRILIKHGSIDQDALARSFGGEFDSGRGYGSGMLFDLLPKLRAGGDWRKGAAELFGGRGSFGNGAAMRVAPLGAYFADDLREVVRQAHLSAVVTHAHPEGIAGGIAVAVAAALVASGVQFSNSREFIEAVLGFVPASEVQAGLRTAVELPANTNADQAAQALGNGSCVTAQDTVPFCVWAAGRHLDDYEEALWQTVSVLGDMDTNCAIVGGILAARLGGDVIPSEWLRSRESLPTWHLTDGHQFVR